MAYMPSSLFQKTIPLLELGQKGVQIPAIWGQISLARVREPRMDFYVISFSPERKADGKIQASSNSLFGPVQWGYFLHRL